MPFAEDHRNYSFQSLDRLFNKRGQQLEKHQNLPTDEMMDAMESFVDSMDLMEVEKDDEGCVRRVTPILAHDYDRNRMPYFDTLYSYNPALHRVKQALYHAAVSPSLSSHPLPPPHPELVKYFEPPKKILKRSKVPLEECKKLFDIKQGPFLSIYTVIFLWNMH
jgi:ATP-dependent DNA helicase 2 subunit 2